MHLSVRQGEPDNHVRLQGQRRGLARDVPAGLAAAHGWKDVLLEPAQKVGLDLLPQRLR